MTETLSLNEKLKILIRKVNSIQGKQLKHDQRLKALEEKKPETDFQIPDVAAFTYMINYLFKDSKPWEDEVVEAINREGKVVELKPEDSILGRAMPKEEEVIDPETLDALDEIIDEG